MQLVLNQDGDEISNHDDKTLLTGLGYADFTIVGVPAMTQAQYLANKRAVIPEIRMYKKSGKLEVETDTDTWLEIKTEPKYDVNFADLLKSEIELLKTADLSVSAALINSRIKSVLLSRIDDYKITVA